MGPAQAGEVQQDESANTAVAWELSRPWSVSSQKVAVTRAARALGALGAALEEGRVLRPAARHRGVLRGDVQRRRRGDVLAAIASLSTLLGLSSIFWVMPVSPAPDGPELAGLGQGLLGEVDQRGRMALTVNGVMPTWRMSGARPRCWRCPGPEWSSRAEWTPGVLPRGPRWGSVVAGISTHRPGSMCSPAFRFLSEICCRYVRPNMLMSGCSKPRLGICPWMTSNASCSLVRLSSRKWSEADV